MDKRIKKKLIELVSRSNFLDATEDRICYSYDATREMRIPDAVVFPRNVREVAEIMKIANAHLIPVVPRGAGSGFSGGAIPMEGGIVLGMNHFDRIIEIDTDNLQAIVEPGVVTAKLQTAVEKKGLFYPPDPASLQYASIGGNIAENAGGMRAVKYGVTKDYVMGLEVVLPSGEIVHTGSKCVKDVVGYNLTQLFVGSEGTLGIVTRAILKLLPLPEAKKTLTATFSNMAMAGQTVSEIIKNRIIPTTLEFLDKHSLWAVEDYLGLGLPTEAEAFLLIEVDGDADQIGRTMKKVSEVCRSNGALEVKIANDKKQQDELWQARRSVSPSLMKIRPTKVNEDIVVPRNRIPEILRKIGEISTKHNLIIVNFGHAGDGNIHVNILSDRTREALARVHQAVDDIFRATVALEGQISGEHGIGISKRDYIGLSIDEPTLSLMRRIKSIFDPNHILNPGKIFPPPATAVE
jgi:glycolate oxidase